MEIRRLRIHVPDWFKLIFLLVILFIAYRILSTIPNTIVYFLVGAILAYILHPFVNWLERHGSPRWLAVTIVFIVAALIISLFVYLLAPPFADQIRTFAKQAPRIAEKANIDYENLRNRMPDIIKRLLPPNLQNLVNSISKFASSQSSSIGGIVGPIVSAVGGTILVIVFSIYILLFLMEMDGWVRIWIPDQYHWLYDRLVEQLDTGYSGYIIGQVIVSVVHGITVGIVAFVFGLPFPILQGIYAGIIQIIPIIGPILAIIPAILLALLVSIPTAIIVAIILIILMSVEGVILTPYILGAAADISPILMFIFIVAGGEVGGAGGSILAVPVLVFLNIIWQFLRDNIYYRPAPPPEQPPTMLEMQPPPEVPPSERAIPERDELSEKPKGGEVGWNPGEEGPTGAETS